MTTEVSQTQRAFKKNEGTGKTHPSTCFSDSFDFLKRSLVAPIGTVRTSQ